MAASEKVLGEIHDATSKWCRLILEGVPLLDKEGSAVLKEDGQPWLVPPSAAHLTVIRAFLKDNEITCDPTNDSSVDALRKKLEERRRREKGAVVIDPMMDLGLRPESLVQ